MMYQPTTSVVCAVTAPPPIPPGATVNRTINRSTYFPFNGFYSPQYFLRERIQVNPSMLLMAFLSTHDSRDGDRGPLKIPWVFRLIRFVKLVRIHIWSGVYRGDAACHAAGRVAMPTFISTPSRLGNRCRLAFEGN